MKQFFTQSGNYLYLVVAALSFLLGTTSSVMVGWITRGIEKRRLIDLFLEDIHRNWKELDQLKAAPVGNYFSRAKYVFKGVDITLTGEPEYDFEVHNIKLYDTEGVRLAQHLRRKARREFWNVYALLRDTEAVRQVINSLPKEDKSRPQYQALFVELVTLLAKRFTELDPILRRERSLAARLFW